MKLPLLVLIFASLSCHAFDIPKSSHNLAQIKEAQKKAAQKNQPLAFVISQKNLTAT